MTTTPSRRSLLRASVWAAPAVSVVAAAPAFAASTPGEPRPTLAGRADGPSEYADSGSTVYGIYVTNTGTEPIAGGTLTALLPDPGDGYSFSGVAGMLWNYADTFPDGQIAFRYDPELAAGEESDILLLLINSDDRSQSPVPVANLLLTAPGYDATVLPLTVPF
ncbi:hypothetical protein [Nocardioides alkalitolerans]|uniref:hypothetical protein n=1 Tax=Nocardioides alkalitolerans TaxID=281714 RepID=UPI0003FCFB9A|nr:hypothetical protein [Nocardioides alkalitolerans]